MKTLRMPDAKLKMKTFTFECSNRKCSALLQASEDEGLVHSSYQGTSVEFECPHCGQDVWVDYSTGRDQ